MASVKESKKLRFKMAIIVLSILCLLSFCALVARPIFWQQNADSATVMVPNNFLSQRATDTDVQTPSDIPSNEENENFSAPIGLSMPEIDFTLNSSREPAVPLAGEIVSQANPSASLLEFYRWQDEYNKKFEVTNMLPGDTETRYFCVKAHHTDDVTLVFQAEITEQTRLLGDVLDVTVTNLDTNKVICQGTFNQINGAEFKEKLAKNTAEETIRYYRIDVSMDTSVDNPYQVARLLADFNWYIQEEQNLSPPPQTGDPLQISLYIILGGSALSIFVLLILAKRRKDDEEEEQYE
ncbi:MAG: LPXTG cell wall anchor domain-containing protein [Clostridia bacterium]|nr:LPXTG cell wall anchor domain-containing protein [Clostridia bacterium]